MSYRYGLLLAAALLLVDWSNARAQSLSASRDLVINEIQYAPSPAQNEFFELYNRSDRTFDLRDLAFSDDRENPIPITDSSTTLPPGGYAVIVRDATLFSEAFPNVPFVVPPRWDALNNDGDAVVLYADDAVIDRVPYAPSWGGASGASLERIDPAGPSDRPSNFGTSTAPNGATPGHPNSIFAPDTSPPVVQLAEVTAADTVRLRFNEPVNRPPRPAALTLEDGTVPATLRRSDDARRLTLGFAQAVTGVRLRVADVPDLVGNTLRDTSVYLGYSPDPDDLALSEIMFAPQADDFDGIPNQPEYFEVTSRADHGIALRGLFWTDRPDETGAADTTTLGEAAQQVLSPGGRAVVYAEPDPAADPAVDGQLATAFPEIDYQTSNITLLPIGATSLGLRNAGDRIRLHHAGGTPLTTVTYAPDWHASDLIDPRGVALERLSLNAPAGAPSNWTSSVASNGGTPGHPNSVQLNADAPANDLLTITPSPFSPDGDGFEDATRIRYRLTAEVASVRVRIYDAMGRLVRTLEESRLGSSTGELLWDGRGDGGRSLRMGIYVVLFEAVDARGGRVITLKRPVVLAHSLR